MLFTRTYTRVPRPGLALTLDMEAIDKRPRRQFDRLDAAIESFFAEVDPAA